MIASLQPASNALIGEVHLRRYAGGGSMAPHQHPTPSLCLVIAGGYQEHTRGRISTHTPGHLLFCPAFELHAQQFDAPGAVKFLMTPAPAGIDYLNERSQLADAPFMHCMQIAALGARIAAEFRLDDDFSALAIHGLAIEALALFARLSQPRLGVPQAWLREAIDFIQAHAAQGFHIDDLARAVGHHPVHICRAFRNALGITVAGYARNLRVNRAAILLRSGKQSVAEIALICGFSDQPHLSRSFKAVFGVTPGAYRSAS